MTIIEKGRAYTLYASPLPYVLIVGVVIKVTLNQHDRGSLVARTGGQITQGTDQVGKLSWGGTLRSHVADQIRVLGLDAFGDRRLQLFTVKMLEIIIGEVFEPVAIP